MVPSTQQAVLVNAFGARSHDLHAFVSVGEVPVVPAGQGEVLVKMLMRPVNPAGTPARGCRRHDAADLHQRTIDLDAMLTPRRPQTTTASMAPAGRTRHTP
jgi:NADPH:quinone reductase-like Zn-dependent oxidoreductase